MADETNLDAGDNAEDVIAGKKNQQHHTEQRSDPRQSVRGGDTYYNAANQDNEQRWITNQILDHAQQLRELTFRLDDLPNKFAKLEIRVEKQDDRQGAWGERVTKLEDLEVIVRKESIVIQPAAPPNSTNLSMRTLAIGLIVVALAILTAVGYLIYLQVHRPWTI